jgi:hypothetical protein
MKVVEPGHVYTMDTIDSRGSLEPQTVRFLRRSSSLIQHPYEAEGTNTQELLRVAIDRTKYLDRIQPCSENEDILFCLRHALFLYEARAYRRKINKVNKGQGAHLEGSETFKDVPFDVRNHDMETSQWIEELPTGPDGHILVEEQI